MKKLLHINTTAGYGSVAGIAAAIARRTREGGWESYMAAGRTTGGNDPHIIRIGRQADFIRHAMTTRLTDRHGFGSKRATISFLKELDKIGPDIIHLHNLHGYYINIEELFGYIRTNGIPTVWTLHDCWPFTGHCAHFAIAECGKWRTGCGGCPRKREYPASWFRDNSSGNFKRKNKIFTSVEQLHIVAVSQWLAGIARHSFLGRYPVTTIGNGTDLSVFHPKNDAGEIRKKYIPDGKFLILGAATAWTKSKGLYDFHRLREKLDDSYAIMLAGLTRRQIKSLPPGITGIGKTGDREEMASLYRAAGALVSLSYQESFGLTPVEAFACGTPAVVYDNTAQLELIAPSTGFTAVTGDTEGVAAAIKKIREYGRGSFSAVCRLRAEKLYDERNKTGEYMAIYDKILNGPR